MTDPTEEFFAKMQANPQPALHNVQATLRIDLTDRASTAHWYLEIDHGKITVSHRADDADAVVRGERVLFEQLVSGRANAFAAALRGQIRFEGDARLLVALQSVLPGPPDQRRVTVSTKEGV
jgi:putative sterol carrier protein